MSINHIEWTGERLVTSVNGIGVKEHLHRYAFAREFVNGQIVLDIASGEGYGSNLLSVRAQKVTGIDISKEAVEFANTKYGKPNLSFIEGSVTKIPLEKNSVDIVVSFETIEHINDTDQELMLQEIKRVLKSDGLLVISSPERSNYGDINKETNHFHIKELYLSEFETLIKNNFKNVGIYFQKTVYGSLIVPKTEGSFSYSDYSGDFNGINDFNTIQKPVFNICIASDRELPELSISFFDGQEYYDLLIGDLEREINRIRNSRNFKTGELLLTPIRKIRKLFSI